jgi:hypothetical protein
MTSNTKHIITMRLRHKHPHGRNLLNLPLELDPYQHHNNTTTTPNQHHMQLIQNRIVSLRLTTLHEMATVTNEVQ